MRIALRTVARPIGLIASLSLGGLLAACGKPAETVNIVAIGSPDAPFEAGARLSPTGQLVRAATVEGLVGFDEQGRVIPGLADRWIVTDDGQSYIFRLRDGIWGDGSPITAQSARAGLREALAALRGTPLGLDLAGVDEIRVMAGRVVEIRLGQPMPNLLQLLAQPELGLKRKDQWTGPMLLTRARGLALLTPQPPERRGLPAEQGWSDRMRPVRLAASDAAHAVERFNRGDADVLLGGRIEHFPFAGSVGLSRGTIQLDPVTGLLGLEVLHDDGFLSAPENREALAMAIDRPALIAPFNVGGWVATTRIVAPMESEAGLIGERWAGLTIEQLRAQAAARVARWRAGHPADAAPRIRIALPAGPGSDILFTRLKEDLAAIGLEAARAEAGGGADLRLMDAVARYPSPVWFLNQFNCGLRRAICSPAADMLVAQANAAATAPEERTRLLADAEAELTRENVYIPFGAPIRWSLVRGAASGFAVNRWAVHPLMPMARRPR